MDRNENIERVNTRTEPWDIVVIGGGATGVGCALDAATRGLEVLLVEQQDFGWGTSSRSTKLVHGGVRYLRQGNISLVREALRERAFLLRNAPHVVHVQEFIVPCDSVFQKLFYGVGLKVYDLLAGKLSIGRSRSLSLKETIDRLPTVRSEGLVGGILYLDGQFDDTRLLIDMATTASRHGACLINYMRVGNLTNETGGNTRISLYNTISGEFLETSARTVINATGAFCDPIRKMSDDAAKPVVTFARGSHIVLPRKFLPSNHALMIPKTSDGRVLFCIPWHEHVLVGTTDVPCENTENGRFASNEEIEFLLETAGEYLATQPTRNDILSKFAGVRPLVSRLNTTNTAKMSRSHELYIDDNGLITITGGKWTTYRQMAEEAVDAAIRVGQLSATHCVTKTLPIDAPPPSTGKRLHPNLPYTMGDIERAIRMEMAMKLEDVLARRTRALFLNTAATRELGVQIAEIIGTEHHRNDAQIAEDAIWFDIVAKSYL